MRRVRQVVAVIVQVLAALGMIGCLAGIVGLWVFRQYAEEKVRTVTARVDSGLERATTVIVDVEQALKKARDEVTRVRKESPNLSGGEEKNRLVTDLLRGMIRERLGPRIQEVDGKLVTFSEAAVVVSSLLQSFQELPTGEADRIPKERLKAAAEQVAQLSANLQKLQAVIGDGNTAATEKEVDAATREVDHVLAKCEAMVGEWRSDLNLAQEEVSRLRTRALTWLTPATIAGTLVCAWLAVSQMSLLVHARTWCRRA